MTKANGYNPMRWQCERDGCYNAKHRPKIEEFCDIWPGRISMSDVDGIVEICGNFLLLEWKSVDKPMPTGQRIMYERMTVGGRFTVIVVTGNPETMEVSKCMLWFDGKRYPKIGQRNADMRDVRSIMTRWCDHARKNPRIGKT